MIMGCSIHFDAAQTPRLSIRNYIHNVMELPTHTHTHTHTFQLDCTFTTACNYCMQLHATTCNYCMHPTRRDLHATTRKLWHYKSIGASFIIPYEQHHSIHHCLRQDVFVLGMKRTELHMKLLLKPNLSLIQSDGGGPNKKPICSGLCLIALRLALQG